MKAGYLTTEFWTTLAVHAIGLVVSLASLFGHVVDPTSLNALVPAVAVLASALAQAVYTHSRSKVKAAALAAGK